MKKLILLSSIIFSMIPIKIIFSENDPEDISSYKKLQVSKQEYNHLNREKNNFKRSRNIALLDIAIKDCKMLVSASFERPIQKKFIEEQRALTNRKYRILNNAKDFAEGIAKIDKLSRSNLLIHLNEAIAILNELIDRDIYPRKMPTLFQRLERLEKDKKNLGYKNN